MKKNPISINRIKTTMKQCGGVLTLYSTNEKFTDPIEFAKAYRKAGEEGLISTKGAIGILEAAKKYARESEIPAIDYVISNAENLKFFSVNDGSYRANRIWIHPYDVDGSAVTIDIDDEKPRFFDSELEAAKYLVENFDEIFIHWSVFLGRSEIIGQYT